jgi:hypothetical protein
MRLESTSVIAAATPVNALPFSGHGGWDVPRFMSAGQTAANAAANPSLNLESIHPNYFETFQIRILRGRSFTDADREGALNVAIISEDVARTWPGDDPIGKRLKMGGPDSEDPWWTVVGVAEPTRYRELKKARSTLYLPARQFLNTARMLVVRRTASLNVIASLSQEHVRAVDPDVQVIRVAPFSRLLDTPLARPRFGAVVTTQLLRGMLFEVDPLDPPTVAGASAVANRRIASGRICADATGEATRSRGDASQPIRERRGEVSLLSGPSISPRKRPPLAVARGTSRRRAASRSAISCG